MSQYRAYEVVEVAESSIGVCGGKNEADLPDGEILIEVLYSLNYKDALASGNKGVLVTPHVRGIDGGHRTGF